MGFLLLAPTLQREMHITGTYCVPVEVWVTLLYAVLSYIDLDAGKSKISYYKSIEPAYLEQVHIVQ